MPDLIPLNTQARGIHSTRGSPAIDERIQVSRALESLQLDHRTVLLLAVVEGFSCGEIAEILSIPVGTVMSRLSRARHSMRLKLDQTKSPAAVKCSTKEV